MEWISIIKQLPPYGEDVLICYKREGKVIIEVGYRCGDTLMKGISERYPYPEFWMPFPEPPEQLKENYFFLEDPKEIVTNFKDLTNPGSQI